MRIGKWHNIFPLAFLALSGLGLWHLFPEFEEMSEWALPVLGNIPYLAWFLLGGLLGWPLHLAYRRWPREIRKVVRTVFLGMVGWLGLGLFITILTEEGNLIERVNSGVLLKGWFMILFASLMCSPSLLGVFAVFSRSKWALSISILMLFLTAATTMIYSQASGSVAVLQDPLLSLLLIFAVLGYVEASHLVRKYETVLKDNMAQFGDDGGRITGILFWRQVISTTIFILIGAILAMMPYLWTWLGPDNPPYLLSLYEYDTILGKALLGIAILIPLGSWSLLRNRFRAGKKE